MEFGNLCDLKSINEQFNRMRTESRSELIQQIYRKSGWKSVNEATVQSDLADAFTALICNYSFDKSNPIVKEIAALFDIDLDSLIKYAEEERIQLVKSKIRIEAEDKLKIIEEKVIGKDKEVQAETVAVNPENHFEWIGAATKFGHLRSIFEEILLEKVRMFDAQLTELTELQEAKINESQLLRTTLRMHSPVCKSRSTKVSARVDSERQEKIHSKMGKEFCNVLIRDHSEFSLKKWGKQQENEFQRIKANFRSNLRINNVPVLFQFVKKYTTTVKARDNIYRKWEQREMNGITPQQLRYLCATSLFLNNSLARSQKQRIQKNVRSAGKELLSQLQFNIAEKIIETYKVLMKKVSDLRAKYYEEETEKRKLDFDGSVKLARTLACKDDKNSILKKYERMLRTIVESEKMKLKLNFKILRWVNLFISNIKKAIHKPESPKPPPLQLRLLASKQDQNSLLFRLKLKYPSSKIIKRQDLLSHRLKARQYVPSDRFEYDKSFEKSIAIINKIKLASSHRTAFYKQISGGPKPSGEKIRVNLAMKSVKMTSTKCMRAVILIQAKWKAMYQRKLYLQQIDKQRKRNNKIFIEKVNSLQRIYPQGKKINLAAIKSRMERVNMCIVNILKPYERVYRKPINTYTSFCIAKLTPAELKKKYNRNGKISLTEFGKMVQENNHAQLRKSGIVITAKEINEPIYKNGTSAMWWAVYYSNVELARIFLQGGGNPNSKDNDDNTCLHIAMRNGDVQIIFLLLDYGADLNKKNNKKVTCLYFATVKMLKLLGLEEGNVSVTGDTARDNNSLYFRTSRQQEDIYHEHHF